MIIMRKECRCVCSNKVKQEDNEGTTDDIIQR